MRIIILTAILSVFSININSQTNDTLFTAFYNLQNLFDVLDNPVKWDDDFTPEGELKWMPEMYMQKLENLADVITSMNDNRAPDLIGVCEVENLDVLMDLFSLEAFTDSFSVIHLESPDRRGIDNALIYKEDKFEILGAGSEMVFLEDRYPTRLVFYCSLLNEFDDTLHIIVNHWPSRRGGEEESEPNRIAAAEKVRFVVDRILISDPDASIIVMGDFNDETDNRSVNEVLGAANFNCTEYTDTGADLLNLAWSADREGLGTYRYRGNWNMLDQIIISSSLFNGRGIDYLCGSFDIYKPEFILQKEGKYAGTSLPTYGGRTYLGGYSDHFAVTAEFIYK